MLLLCQPLSPAPEAAPPQPHDAAGLDNASAPHEQVSYTAQQPSKPLRDIMIVAIPGQHSRKPHLGGLLPPHLPTRPKCLEVMQDLLCELSKQCTSVLAGFREAREV